MTNEVFSQQKTYNLPKFLYLLSFHLRISDIDVDDLQECLDECPAGKRTRENMRAVISLMYKYGIPRHVIPENLNLAQFLTVTGEGAAKRDSFSAEQIKKIRAAAGTVAYADYIAIMIYTGFRPSEFLAMNPGETAATCRPMPAMRWA